MSVQKMLLWPFLLRRLHLKNWKKNLPDRKNYLMHFRLTIFQKFYHLLLETEGIDPTNKNFQHELTQICIFSGPNEIIKSEVHCITIWKKEYLINSCYFTSLSQISTQLSRSNTVHVPRSTMCCYARYRDSAAIPI